MSVPRRAHGAAVAIASAVVLATLGAATALAAPPTVSITSPADNSTHEIGSVVLADYDCTPNGSPVLDCIGDVPDGQPIDTAAPLGGKTFTVTGTSADGPTEVPHDYTVVDTIPPIPPVPTSPADGGVTNDTTPTFTFQAAGDSGSGVASQAIVIDGGTPIPLSASATSYTVPAGLPLAEGGHTWQVTAVDNAGNPNESAERTFTVDITAPDPPILTVPPTPTSETVLTIGFSGLPGATFNWRVVDTSDDSEVASGSTTSTSVVLPALGEGVYNIEATQTDLGSNESGGDTETVVVDVTAPAAPVVTQRPAALSAHNAALVFGVTGDAHPSFGLGTYGWRVRDSAGRISKTGTNAAGSGTTQVNIGALPSNASYSFDVQQIDQAGNAGPFSAPVAFSILPPPDTPPPPGSPPPPAAPPAPAAASPPAGGGPPAQSAPTTDTRFTPATSNAKRLRPKAAQKLSGRRPVLRWPRVRSASVYNVQIFRVDGTSFVKIYSGFPRGNRMRVPAGKLKFGERYAWRVWPFKGRKATRNPIGSSWFDVRTKAQIYARRVLGPKAVLVAGDTAQIRWRHRAGTRQYRLRLLKDGDRMFQTITRRKRANIPGRLLNESGSYTLLVQLGKGRPSARKFGATWIKAPLQVATAAELAEFRASRPSSR